MTVTRSAMPATTPRSWVIRIMAAPVSDWAFFSTSSTWAWMVTSSAVVGSSAMITSGSLAIAMAIMARWRIPPENSCGNDRIRSLGVRDADQVQQVDGALHRRGPGHVVVDLDGLDDLVSDGVDGGQRRERILEHHRHGFAAQPGQTLVVAPQQLVAVQLDRPLDSSRGRQQAHDRKRGHRLAGPGLTHHGQRLPGGEVEGEAADGADWPCLAREGDVQVGHLQDRPGHGPADLARRGGGGHPVDPDDAGRRGRGRRAARHPRRSR